MKNKASAMVKNMISVLSSLVKSKVMGVKSKASAVRVRFLVSSLLKGKKFSLSTLSNKIQTLLEKKGMEEESKAIILYNAGVNIESRSDYDYNNEYPVLQLGYYDEDEEKYPDLTHCLFDEGDDQEGSVIDIVRNSKEQEGGNFVLEDEIDDVADLFIRRFKKHMRLEKLESFKRCQAMLGRGA